MTIKFYIPYDDFGNEILPEHTFELDSLRLIARQLWKKYHRDLGQQHFAMIAGVENPPADLIIISSNGLGILDLKNFSGKVLGADDSEWRLIDDFGNTILDKDGKPSILKGGSSGGKPRINPLDQVRDYKVRISKILQEVAKQKNNPLPSWLYQKRNPKGYTQYYYFSCGVVFTKGFMDTTELKLKPKAVEPWFKLLQADEVADWAFTLTFGDSSYRLNPKQIDFIAREVFKTNEWKSIQPFLEGGDPYGYLWEIVDGQRRRQNLLIDDEITIGCATDNKLYYSQEIYQAISRHHAIIRKIGTDVLIFDDNSKHGTWVDGERLEENQSATLRSGTEIVLGKLNHPDSLHLNYKAVSRQLNETVSLSSITISDGSVAIEDNLEEFSNELSKSFAEAYKQEHGIYPGQYVRVTIDPISGRIETYIGYLVVDEVKSPEKEISLSDAIQIDPDIAIGDIQLLPSDWSPTKEEIHTVIEQASQSLSISIQSAPISDESPSDIGVFTSSLLGGQLLDSRFYLYDDYKSGGFGHVYRASQRNMGNRTVAVKVLKSGRIAEELYKEANQSAKLEHQNIVRLYDIGTTEDGVTYLVMEWIDDGKTLKEWREEKLAYEADFLGLVRLARDIAEGLHYIHENGVVHGDISPRNVLLKYNNRDEKWIPKLTDFGLSWTLSDGQPDKRGGTPLYLAPELFNGQPGTSSDIYSLGAVLFYLFTGKHHLGEINEISQLRLNELRHLVTTKKAIKVSDVQNGIFNPDLDNLIDSMVSIDPDNRPPNVSMIIDKLEQILSYAPTDDAVNATITYYMPTGVTRSLVDKIRELNPQWIDEKLQNVPDWYIENPQNCAEILQHILGQDEEYETFVFNNGTGRDGNLEMKICFATQSVNKANVQLASALNSALLLYGEIKPDRNNLFISGISFLPLQRSNFSTSNSKFTKLVFTLNRNHYPQPYWEIIQALPRETLPDPDTEERLKHWQGYLDVWLRLAKEKQYTVEYTSWSYSDDKQDSIWFMLSINDASVWKKIKQSNGQQIDILLLKTQEEMSHAKNKRDDDPYNHVKIGEIQRVDESNSRIKIQLDDYFTNRTWKQESNAHEIPLVGELDYSAGGDLNNVSQQQKALADLTLGRTANRRLNRFIFNAQDAALPNEKTRIHLDPQDMLSRTLNEDQIHAVEGALSAPDLYLIQGPPGTGKTTVISELCYQFTKRGQRVLLASQANLAVDNALSRLSHKRQILAIRMGNKYEDEGEKFAEENVVKRWFEETLAEHRRRENFLSDQMSAFGFVVNHDQLHRYAEILQEIAPCIDEMLIEQNSRLDHLKTLEDNIKNYKLELSDTQKWINSVDALAQTLDTSTTQFTSLSWRNRSIDLLAKSEFEQYVHDLLLANTLLQQSGVITAKILRQHLNVSERDAVRRINQGISQAIHEISNPFGILRVGNAYAYLLLATDLQDGEWCSNAINIIDQIKYHYECLELLEDMPRLQSDHQTAVEISEEIHSTYVARLKNQQEIESLGQSIDKVQHDISVATERITQHNDLIRDFNAGKKLITDGIRNIGLLQGQAVKQQSSPKLKELENYLHWYQIFLGEFDSILKQPHNFIATQNRTIFVDISKLHISDTQPYDNYQPVIEQNDSSQFFVDILNVIESKLKSAHGRLPRAYGKRPVSELIQQWNGYLFNTVLDDSGNGYYEFSNHTTYVDFSNLLKDRPINTEADREVFEHFHRTFLEQLLKYKEYQLIKILVADIAESRHKLLVQIKQTKNDIEQSKKVDDKEKNILSSNIVRPLSQIIQTINQYLSDQDLNTIPVLISGKIAITQLNDTIQKLNDLQHDMDSLINEQHASTNTLQKKIKILQKKLSQLLEQRSDQEENAKSLNEHLVECKEDGIGIINHFRTSYSEGSVIVALCDSMRDLLHSVENLEPIAAIEEQIRVFNTASNGILSLLDSMMEGSSSWEDASNKVIQKQDKLFNEIWQLLQSHFTELPYELAIDCLPNWYDYLMLLNDSIHDKSRLIENLRYNSIVAKWHQLLEQESQQLNAQLTETYQLYETEQNDLKILGRDIEQLNIELAEWDELWQTGLNSIPSHLQDQLPDKSKYTNKHEYVLAVAKVSQSHSWHEEHQKLSRQHIATKNLLDDWRQRLASQQQRDIDSIHEYYMEHANVIGTSCGQVRRLDIQLFDVAIIDEVSKATPPELLMPMIRARKVILLGDHKQLPPMIGSDSTMKDIAEDLNIPEEHLKHLEVPLFKHLYNSAPKELKIMLREQYRMRPIIRDAITIFYDGELRGGHDRSHGLDMPGVFSSNTALAWISTPRTQDYAEQIRGTSFENPSEVKIIEQLLQKMNASWQLKLQQGVVDKPKDVGLITFYMPQMKLIQKLGSRNQFSALNLRVGTVDRFQGMERPVIIVSTVRNNSRSSIGFAKAPERINVAFSRAQELLVVVGCLPMFTQAKGAGQNYQHIANLIKHSEGGKVLNVPDEFSIN